MPHYQDHFETDDGLRLHENRWLPQDEPAAIVVVVHGLSEHSGRYAEMAAALNRQGWAVYAFDLRGHGQSEGERIWIDSFQQYVDDVEAYVAEVRRREPGKPLFLFGHSMGGTIGLCMAAERNPNLRGLIVTAPALVVAADMFPILRRVAGLVSHLLPRLRVMKISGARVSRDPEVVAQFQADPLVFHGRIPARTSHEILQAARRLQERLEDVTLPLLILHGTGDVVTDVEGSRQLHAGAGSIDKTLKLYDGLYHDLPREPEKGQIIADVVEWIEARTIGQR